MATYLYIFWFACVHQHACRYKWSQIVKLLVALGQADIQARSTSSGAVPLHEAAASGSVECIRSLLFLNAPSCPRNRQNETPADLAMRASHTDCVTLLANHTAAVPRYCLSDYYHGCITREDAQIRLREATASRTGHFLLRRSVRMGGGSFVLTVLAGEQVFHFEVCSNNTNFYIDDSPYFGSVETLIDHYLRFMDGLPTRLHTPVCPTEALLDEDLDDVTTSQLNIPVTAMDDDNSYLVMTSPPNSAFSTLQKHGNATPDIVVTNSISFGSPNRHPKKEEMKLDLSMHSLNNNSKMSTLDQLTPPPCGVSPTMDGNKTEEVLGTIDSLSLIVGPTLGMGEFGSVLKGIWTGPSGDKIDVAVKTLHDNNTVNKRNFLHEASVMMNLNHPYIVKLLGVCHGPPLAMVQELVPMGSLLDFLLDHPDQVSIEFHIKLWAAQMAQGMLYLEQKHFVHRDLAARNILLSSLTLAKISDFGLSRALGVGKEYYAAQGGGRWPIKWYAPESVNYGTFTHSSDVWSYAVTLWEMYTFGDQPYGNLPGHQVIELVEAKKRLPKPEKCPSGVYDLMMQCWNYKPKCRPSFRELASIFRTQPEYANIKPYFK